MNAAALIGKHYMAHILITNDDGIQAEGLRALVQAMEGVGTISVVAPNHERSASAQSLTLRQPIFWEQVAEREWAVEGTPTDAVILALHKLLPNRPDVVISGINRGGNLGENVFYSGTVGAAMEAAINHVPAVAISVAHKGRGFRFEQAAKFARELAQVILAEGMPQGVLLNVNVPLTWNGSVRFTRQSSVTGSGGGGGRCSVTLEACLAFSSEKLNTEGTKNHREIFLSHSVAYSSPSLPSP